jgi:hypothetical protein
MRRYAWGVALMAYLVVAIGALCLLGRTGDGLDSFVPSALGSNPTPRPTKIPTKTPTRTPTRTHTPIPTDTPAPPTATPPPRHVAGDAPEIAFYNDTYGYGVESGGNIYEVPGDIGSFWTVVSDLDWHYPAGSNERCCRGGDPSETSITDPELPFTIYVPGEYTISGLRADDNFTFDCIHSGGTAEGGNDGSTAGSVTLKVFWLELTDLVSSVQGAATTVRPNLDPGEVPGGFYTWSCGGGCTISPYGSSGETTTLQGAYPAITLHANSVSNSASLSVSYTTGLDSTSHTVTVSDSDAFVILAPTPEPSQTPAPTIVPTEEPTPLPTNEPTEEPTEAPTPEPTQAPTATATPYEPPNPTPPIPGSITLSELSFIASETTATVSATLSNVPSGGVFSWQLYEWTGCEESTVNRFLLPDGTESDHFTGDSASATIIAHGTSSGLDTDRVRVYYTVPDPNDPNSYLSFSDKEGYTTFDLRIEKPSYSYHIEDAPDYNKAEVDLLGDFRPDGVEGTIDWKLKLEYATSTGHGSGAKSKSATTNSGQESTQTFTSAGGKVTCNVIGTAYGQTTEEKTFTLMIAGVSIPDPTIRERLLELYSGATSDLLCGICYAESTFMQFSNIVLYESYDKWPQESPDPCLGEYIGLMQCDVTFERAWDWKVNTQIGADIFNGKMNATLSYENRIKSEYPGLRDLSGVEREDNALALYGGFNPDVHQLYYCNENKDSPEWLMYDPGSRRTTYITKIRTNTQYGEE